MEYDYDLFEEARKQCTDVTLEMIQVQNEANKVKGCPLPEGFNGEYLSALVNEVIKLKTDGIAIQKTVNQWAAAVDEAYRAQCGEEYNDLISQSDDLQRQIDEQAAYLGQLGNSRCTDMNLWNAQVEIMKDLKKQKEDADKKKDELAGILGISTEDDQKWYDVLQDATDSLITDCKSLATDYGEMFKSMGTDAFTDNFTTVVNNTRLLGAKLDATKDQIGSDILRGVGNVTENILDFAGQIGSWLVFNTGITGTVLTVDEWLGGNMKDKAEEWTQSFISKDIVDGIYNDYYTKTEQGKLTNEYSYIKYDDALAEGINVGTQRTIEFGAVIASSLLLSPPVGAIVAAAFTGASEGGKAVNKAYDNGATYDEATLYSALVGGANAALAYVGSSHITNLFSSKASASILKKLISVGLDTVTASAIPAVDSIAEWLTWGSDYHTGEDLKEIWEKNATTQSMLINAGIAFGLSAGGELLQFLIGKYGKKVVADVIEKPVEEYKGSKELEDLFNSWKEKGVNSVEKDDIIAFLKKNFPELAEVYGTNAATAKKLIDLLGFEDHGFLHILRVADGTKASYDEFIKYFNKRGLGGYSKAIGEDLDFFHRLEGLLHDTGMGGQYTLAVNKKTKALYQILEDKFGTDTRIQHPWRSAFYLLDKYEDIGIPSDQKEFIATVVAAHSKSNSGLKHISSESEMTDLIRILYNGSKESLDGVGTKYAFDIGNLVKTAPDGTPKMKWVFEDGLPRNVYDFKDGVLEQLRTDCASLRIGDSIAFKTGFNQAGGKIVIEKFSGKDIIFDPKNSGKSLDALVSEEATGSVIKVEYEDGNVVELMSSDEVQLFSKKIIMGERNCPGATIGVDSTGKLVYTFDVGSTDCPASTIRYGIGEKFGEMGSITKPQAVDLDSVESFEDLTIEEYKAIPQEVVIKLPKDADDALIDFYKKQTRNLLNQSFADINVSNPEDIVIKVIVGE